MDPDNTPPTLLSALVKSGGNAIEITFSEPVKVPGSVSTDDFSVRDAAGNSYEVDSYFNGNTTDNLLDLNLDEAVNSAVGDLRISYSVTNGSARITDFANLELKDSLKGIFIERDFDFFIDYAENNTNTFPGDDEINIALYRSTSDPTSYSPITIARRAYGSTISIYRDEGLSDLVVSHTAAANSKSTFSPTVGAIMKEDVGPDRWADDDPDVHGVFTFYITETDNSGVIAEEGIPSTYSLAFLDDITLSTSAKLFSGANTDGVKMTLFNHPKDQTLTFVGNGLTEIGYDPKGGSPGLGKDSARFVPSVAGVGFQPISIILENDTTHRAATFQAVESFSVLESSTVLSSDEGDNFCRSELLSQLYLNNPTDVDVGEEVDGPLPDFVGIEIYYIRNGVIASFLSDSVGTLGPGNLIGKIVAYDRPGSIPITADRPEIIPGSPTFVSDEWEIDYSALDTIKGLADRPFVDTLRFHYVVISEDVTDSVVSSVQDVHLFPDPQVKLSNIPNHGFCKNDGDITLQANIKTYPGDIGNDTTGIIRNGYWLQKRQGTGYVHFMDSTSDGSSGPVNTFSPSSANVPAGSYRIIYQSLAVTPAGCTSVDTVEFELFGIPATPTISKIISQSGHATTITSQSNFIVCDADALDESGQLTADNISDSLNWIVLASGNAGGLGVNRFRWFEDATLTKEIIIEDSNGDSATAEELGIEIPAVLKSASYSFYVVEDGNPNTDVTCFSNSNVLQLGFTVNRIQAEPVPILTGNVKVLRDSVIIESCVGDDIPDLVMANTLLSTSASSSTFLWYLEDSSNPGNPRSQPVTTNFDVGDAQDIRITGSAGTNELELALGVDKDVADTVNVWVSQMDFISSAIFPDLDYTGCESGLRKISFITFEVPEKISSADPGFLTEYVICAGETFPDIQAEDDDERILYGWFGDGNNDISNFERGDTVSLSRKLENDDLTGVRTYAENLDGSPMGNSLTTYNNVVPGIYYFWVTRSGGRDVATGFEGCTGSAELISLTVLPTESEEPVFESSVNGTGDPVDVQLFYCSDELASTDSLEATSMFIGSSFSTDANSSTWRSQKKFNWYRSNAAGDALGELNVGKPDGSKIAAAELFLLGDPTDIVDNYYLLTQLTYRIDTTIAIDHDPIFEGCESPGTLVRISVYVKPRAPKTADNKTTYYYCEGDPIPDFNLEGEDGATMSFYDATNGEVKSTDTPVLQETVDADNGVTASMVDLGYTTRPSTGIYRFKVIQQENARPVDTGNGFVGTNFMGCHSDTTTITIIVNDVPDAISFTDPIPYCDEGDATPLTVSFEGKGDFYSIYDSEGVSRKRLARLGGSVTQIPVRLLQAEAGTDTSLYVTRTTSFSSAFEGCESKAKLITVSPVPLLKSFSNGNEIEITEACSEEVKARIDITNPGGLSISDFDIMWSLVIDEDTITAIGDSINVVNKGIENFTRFEVSVVNSKTGCQASATDNVNIGATPKAEFNIANITTGSTTKFNILNREVFEDDVRNSTFYIESRGEKLLETTLPGGIGSGILDTTLQKALPGAGVYNAKLTTISESGCIGEEERSFVILPKVQVSSDTIITFDGNYNNSWYSETNRASTARLNSWEITTPAASSQEISQDAFNGNSVVWITDADSSYGPGEESFVYSPAFDLSVLNKPALKFDFYLDMFNVADGVVFQWSSDDGDTWNVLGDFLESENQGTGINWYNEIDITASPGDTTSNRKKVGWASDHPSNSWLTGIHSLESIDIGDLANIRFRFALASRPGSKINDSNDLAEGFAFDNFTLFSREKSSLVETFSSTLSSRSVEANQALFEALHDEDSLFTSTFWINYFTDLMNGENRVDPIHETKPGVANARLAYYAVRQVPRAALAGKIAVPKTEEVISIESYYGISKRDLETATLEELGFDLTLQSPTIDNNELEVKGLLQARPTLDSLVIPDDSELSLRVMVLQSEVLASVLDLSSPNSRITEEDTVRNVIRSILPNPAGRIISPSIHNRFKLDFEERWEITGILADAGEMVELQVVAFLQNEVTKEIYQATSRTISYKMPETITSVIPSAQGLFKIYPNPTEREFTIELPFENHLENSFWTVTDYSGRIVKTGQIQKGRRKVAVQADALPEGLYLVQLHLGSHPPQINRLMILEGK